MGTSVFGFFGIHFGDGVGVPHGFPPFALAGGCAGAVTSASLPPTVLDPNGRARSTP
jgi:hypothetical protein